MLRAPQHRSPGRAGTSPMGAELPFGGGRGFSPQRTEILQTFISRAPVKHFIGSRREEKLLDEP